MRRFRSRSATVLQAGFTAIELMVATSIVAILAALAAPAYRNLLDSYRVRRAVEDLSASLYLARVEAIRHGKSIVLLRLGPQDGCSGSSATGRWDCGWILFLDRNGNGALDEGELLQRSAPAHGVAIRHSGDNNRLTIRRWGVLPIFGFAFEPASGSATHARVLCSAGGGRLRSAEGTSECE
jgi:type IV fimbrial biogenesis protein FimT